jgi:hypothetical protein
MWWLRAFERQMSPDATAMIAEVTRSIAVAG